MGSKIASAMRGRRAWRVPTLIRHALRTKDEKSAWQCVVLLQVRATRDVFIPQRNFAGAQIRKNVDWEPTYSGS